METQNVENQTQVQENNSEEPVLKPRVQRAKAPKTNETPLVLTKPTTVTGATDVSLHPTMENKYRQIILLDPDGKKVKAVLHDQEKGAKTDSIGASLYDMVLAIANASQSGQGAGPDGNSIWVMDHIKTVEKAVPSFLRYHLKLVPSGRSGAAGYTAPLSMFIDMVRPKAALVQMSIKLNGTAKPLVRTGKVEVQKVTVKL